MDISTNPDLSTLEFAAVVFAYIAAARVTTSAIQGRGWVPRGKSANVVGPAFTVIFSIACFTFEIKRGAQSKN